MSRRQTQLGCSVVLYCLVTAIVQPLIFFTTVIITRFSKKRHSQNTRELRVLRLYTEVDTDRSKENGKNGYGNNCWILGGGFSCGVRL